MAKISSPTFYSCYRVTGSCSPRALEVVGSEKSKSDIVFYYVPVSL